MSKDIVTTSGLPRATTKEKDGVVLFWVEDLKVAGIHQRGLANLLRCDPATVRNAIKGGKGIALLEVEIVTAGGLQGVKLITESDLAKLLRHIARSKAKVETRDRADDLRDQLASAGFKLMVMLELAPKQLQQEVDKHVRLAELQNENLKIKSSLIAMHGKETALLLMGHHDQIIEVEKPTIEIIDERHNVRFEGQTLKQVRDYIYQRHGISFKSGAEVKRFLTNRDMGHLVAQTLRSVGSDYVPSEHLEEVYRVLSDCDRQRLIGE